jgi:hypothetical protein
MRVNLRREQEQITVHFDEAWIRVNVLPIDVIQRIRDKHTKWKRGREVLDDSAFSKDLWDKMIESWGNIIDDDTDEEVPCTSENKSALIRKFPNIGTRIMEEIDDYRDSVLNGRREAEEKN